MEHIEGVTLGQRMNESLGTDQLQASRLTTIGLPTFAAANGQNGWL